MIKKFVNNVKHTVRVHANAKEAHDLLDQTGKHMNDLLAELENATAFGQFHAHLASTFANQCIAMNDALQAIVDHAASVQKPNGTTKAIVKLAQAGLDECIRLHEQLFTPAAPAESETSNEVDAPPAADVAAANDTPEASK